MIALTTVRPWHRGEIALLVSEAGRAPRFGVPRPWVVHPGERTVSLYERVGRFAPHGPDPTGHRRLLACGAALETILVVARVLGREVRCELYPDPGQPDEVGRLTETGRSAPDPHDLALYQAVGRISPSRSGTPEVPPVEDVRVLSVPGGTEPGYLLVTDEDRSIDRVRAGMAAQRIALAARAAGWAVRLTGLSTQEHPDVPGRAQVDVRCHEPKRRA